MPVSKAVEAPEWIENGATPTGGLDLLGLRLPVQTIGLSLLNGVTTVTPSIRYIAIRAWLIHRYSQAQLPDSADEFTKRSSTVGSALVLGKPLPPIDVSGCPFSRVAALGVAFGTLPTRRDQLASANLFSASEIPTATKTAT